MKLTAIEKIENYHLVAIGIKDDGHYTAHSFNSLDEKLIELSAHNIEIGEIIEYKPNKNTEDILTKGTGFDQTGQSWSWSLMPPSDDMFLIDVMSIGEQVWGRR